jgi:uncharacterized protein YodC (DUF2158 family)
VKQKFKKGDVVELKCGSFSMVVESVTTKGVKVIWADEKRAVLMECLLSPLLLMPSTKKNGPPPTITGMIVT